MIDLSNIPLLDRVENDFRVLDYIPGVSIASGMIRSSTAIVIAVASIAQTFFHKISIYYYNTYYGQQKKIELLNGFSNLNTLLRRCIISVARGTVAIFPIIGNLTLLGIDKTNKHNESIVSSTHVEEQIVPTQYETSPNSAKSKEVQEELVLILQEEEMLNQLLEKEKELLLSNTQQADALQNKLCSVQKTINTVSQAIKEPENEYIHSLGILIQNYNQQIANTEKILSIQNLKKADIYEYQKSILGRFNTVTLEKVTLDNAEDTLNVNQIPYETPSTKQSYIQDVVPEESRQQTTTLQRKQNLINKILRDTQSKLATISQEISSLEKNLKTLTDSRNKAQGRLQEAQQLLKERITKLEKILSSLVEPEKELINLLSQKQNEISKNKEDIQWAEEELAYLAKRKKIESTLI